MIIGVLLMGTGLATTSLISGRAAPQGLRVSAHVDVDLGIALASAISALAFAIMGEMAAGGFFAAIAVALGPAGGHDALLRAGVARQARQASAHTST